MKNASIIIVSFNGEELLKANLPSVVKAVERAGGGHEIIVVDNGSADRTEDLIKNSFPSVKLISHPYNLGFIAATNDAVIEADKEIIITLNNDIRVDENYLTPLLKHFEDDQVFAVTPKVYFSDGRSLNAGLKYGYLDKGRFWEVMETDEKKLSVSRPTLYAHGGSAAFDKEKFVALGGFDEIYAPFYQEALDLSYRAQKRGWRVIFEPSSVAYHQHRSTVNRLYTATQIDRILMRNRLLFFWSNISDISNFTAHFSYLADRLWQAVKSGDETFVSAFLLALMNLRRVINRQRARSPHWVRSDHEVLESINNA